MKTEGEMNHGRNNKNTKQFWCEMVGFKYKISNVQAAIGCAQMERIDELINRKREIFFQYYEYFKNIDSIKMNPIPAPPHPFLVNITFGLGYLTKTCMVGVISLVKR